jgi:hypothetical protein
VGIASAILKAETESEQSVAGRLPDRPDDYQAAEGMVPDDLFQHCPDRRLRRVEAFGGMIFVHHPGGLVQIIAIRETNVWFRAC